MYIIIYIYYIKYNIYNILKIPACDVQSLACSCQVLNNVGMISVAFYARGAPCAYCRPDRFVWRDGKTVTLVRAPFDW